MRQTIITNYQKFIESLNPKKDIQQNLEKKQELNRIDTQILELKKKKVQIKRSMK